MLFEYFCFPELQKAMKTNAFSILLLPRASKNNENRCFFNIPAPPWPSQIFQVLAALSEITISLRNCNLNSSIFGLRAPRVDFEGLQNYAETLKINENQCVFNVSAPQSFKNQRKPMPFLCFCSPELQNTMKTNVFSILLLARASNSNENNCIGSGLNWTKEI